MMKLFLILGIILLLGAGCPRKTPTASTVLPPLTPPSKGGETVATTSKSISQPVPPTVPPLTPPSKGGETAMPISPPKGEETVVPAPAPTPSPPMIISSSAFKNGGAIPFEYSCDGGNYNPPLSISNVPEGAKSLALIMDDPDAVQVVGYTWVHWVVWNISPDIKSIAAGSAPAGASEGTTSFGSPGYGGPCPPSGTHRYFFKLYALDVASSNLPSSTTSAGLQAAIKGHILKQATLIGTYAR